MDKNRAQEILEEILEESKQKQQVIITKSNNIPPHNGVTTKTADFIDSLEDNKIMKKVVDEISNNVVKLVNGLDNV